MAKDGLCNALQAHLDDLQQVVDEARAGECDYADLWREIDRVCQEIAYLSEGIASEPDDDEDEDEDEVTEGLDEELDFEEDEEGGADFDEEDGDDL